MLSGTATRTVLGPPMRPQPVVSKSTTAPAAARIDRPDAPANRRTRQSCLSPACPIGSDLMRTRGPRCHSRESNARPARNRQQRRRAEPGGVRGPGLGTAGRRESPVADVNQRERRSGVRGPRGLGTAGRREARWPTSPSANAGAGRVRAHRAWVLRPTRNPWPTSASANARAGGFRGVVPPVSTAGRSETGRRPVSTVSCLGHPPARVSRPACSCRT